MKFLGRLILAMTMLSSPAAYSCHLAYAIGGGIGFAVGLGGLVTTGVMKDRTPAVPECADGDTQFCCYRAPTTSNTSIAQSCRADSVTACGKDSPLCVSNTSIYPALQVQHTDAWVIPSALVSVLVMMGAPIIALNLARSGFKYHYCSAPKDGRMRLLDLLQNELDKMTHSPHAFDVPQNPEASISSTM
ncbi:MAG: hypothetical protein KA436_11895 [Oligoflexales bacterium]|nr:hypothetical protein [Oligoflexales bacterium]